jgi:TPR repeat protein
MNIIPKKITRLASAVLLSSSVGLVFATTYDDAILAFENEDYQTALSLSLPLAKKLDPDAMTLVGRIYDEGLNQPQKALPWFRKSAELGNAQAQLELAELYQAGDGVPQDMDIAISWYEKAAAQDHDEAQLALALHYLEDLNEPEEALTLFEKSANQGNATAQYRLGLLYLGEPPIAADKLKAWHYFSLAADTVPDAAQARDILQLGMSSTEIQQATVILEKNKERR